jgi:hypothetical protein
MTQRIRKDSPLGTLEIQNLGKQHWLRVFEILVRGDGVIVSSGSSFEWRCAAVEVPPMEALELGLERARLGAIVLNTSEYMCNGVILGSLLVDINGILVLFESFDSIQKRLDEIPRPVCLRMLHSDQIYDTVFWENDLGMLFSPAFDVARIKNLPKSKSNAVWDAGMRIGDIITAVDDIRVSEINYLYCSNALRDPDRSESICLSTVGPRIISSYRTNHINSEIEYDYSTEWCSLLCSSGVPDQTYTSVSLGAAHIVGTIMHQIAKYSCIFTHVSVHDTTVDINVMCQILQARFKKCDALMTVIATIAKSQAQLKNDNMINICSARIAPLPCHRRQTSPLEIYERDNYLLLEKADTECLSICLPLLVQSIPSTLGLRFASFWSLTGQNFASFDEKEKLRTPCSPLSPLLQSPSRSPFMFPNGYYPHTSSSTTNCSPKNTGRDARRGDNVGALEYHDEEGREIEGDISHSSLDSLGLINADISSRMSRLGSALGSGLNLNISKSNSMASIGTGTGPDLCRNNLSLGISHSDHYHLRHRHSVVKFLIQKCLNDDTMLCSLYWQLRASSDPNTSKEDICSNNNSTSNSTSSASHSINHKNNNNYHGLQDERIAIFKEALQELVTVLVDGIHQAYQSKSNIVENENEKDQENNIDTAFIRAVLLGHNHYPSSFLSSNQHSTSMSPLGVSVLENDDHSNNNDININSDSNTDKKIELTCSTSWGIQSGYSDDTYTTNIDHDRDERPWRDVDDADSISIAPALHVNEIEKREKQMWMLVRQSALFAAIQRSNKRSLEESGGRISTRQIRLRELIAQELEITDKALSRAGTTLWPVANPLQPTQNLNRIVFKKCSIMRSSKQPILLCFAIDYEISKNHKIDTKIDTKIEKELNILDMKIKQEIKQDTCLELSIIENENENKNENEKNIVIDKKEDFENECEERVSVSVNVEVGAEAEAEVEAEVGAICNKDEDEDEDLKSTNTHVHTNTHTNDSDSDSEQEQFVNLLYKPNDEIKQDEFILNLFSFLDKIVLSTTTSSKYDSNVKNKKESNDNDNDNNNDDTKDPNFWRLTHYRVMALGARNGLVEWSQDAVPISDIIRQYNNTIDMPGNPLGAFLRKHHPSPNEKYGIDGNVMETFIRSVAASSVLTYVFGVGDRHMDNLLLRTNGAFLHVDFGYCFGRDPKPFTTPLRFTTEMLACLGGAESLEFERCMLFAAAAYRTLRSDASLLLSMLWLISDAGISDLSVEQHPMDVIRAVHGRLQLNLTDVDADRHIREIVEHSFKAVMPSVFEAMHQIAMHFH